MKKSKRLTIAFAFSLILLTGIITCFICNFAISGSLTWSLIPFVSSCFAWLLLFPCIIFKKKEIVTGLISLSIFIIPYLYLLSDLTKTKTVFSVGSLTALSSIVFLWIVYAVFRRFKTRKLIASGITFLLAVLLVFTINLILYKMTAEPVFDIWDFLSVFILLILAIVFLKSNKK